MKHALMIILALVALTTSTVASVAQEYPGYPDWARKAFCSYRPACGGLSPNK
jgi:hypothetical protein